MLLDSSLLTKIENCSSQVYPKFNIQIFLYILTSTTRPMGYPPLHADIEDDYYIQALSQRVLQSKNTQNANAYEASMRSVYQIMFGFCYFIEVFNYKTPPTEIISLLFQAIEKRENTTDEEIKAESHLLQLFLSQPTSLLNFFSKHQHSYRSFQIPSLLDEQIKDDSQKLVNRLNLNVNFSEWNEQLSETLKIFKQAERGLMFLRHYEQRPKIKCLTVLGCFVLSQTQNFLQAPEIRDSQLIEKSCYLAQKEIGRLKLKRYMRVRSAETDDFAFFNPYPKKVKLSAARKFYKSLDNDSSVIFTKKELDALQQDKGSRLNSIYEDFKTFIPSHMVAANESTEQSLSLI